MQEASVSSTTSSPHKTTTISTENPSKEPNIKANIESKECSEDICYNQPSLIESRSSYHSRRRTHTCSKAGRRRSRSSARKESRKSRNRRRHHRSRRSRSRSHYHSSSRRQRRRRHRRHYATESSSSSSYQSSSRSRSPSRRSQHHRHTSSSSHLTDPPNSRSDNDVNETKLILQNPVQLNIEPSTQIGVAESSKDTYSISNGLPKLTSSNSALNGIVSLLLNSAGSNNALTDLFGSAICGLVGNTYNQTNPPSNSTRQARRLYIGSIPLGITPETMVAFFNTELRSRCLCQSVGDPVVCAQVNSERHFAFIELRSVEETTAALSLDGVNCLGSTLRIRRPRDYFPPGSNPSIHSISHLNANAIFLTGIPSTLSEQSLCRLLSAYGTLRSFNMLRPTELSQLEDFISSHISIIYISYLLYLNSKLPNILLDHLPFQTIKG
ncbi:unnamed protein product [Hymenolepis diminuta]|uniref:RRM domain-containing protein n=1 Tax=Hymenolepis diminuta TaxID=6216 RepID=A0A564ZCJ6_HYMDI|nr:unnamed protein product [Hymenolepis diminuta]